METLPSELKTREIILNLPYENIIYLCRTNNEFNLMCQIEGIVEAIRELCDKISQNEFSIAKQRITNLEDSKLDKIV
jgi:hypothetical protein